MRIGSGFDVHAFGPGDFVMLGGLRIVGRDRQTLADAWAAACDIGVPVVVKPRDANHARGVFTNLITQTQVESAFNFAAREGNGVIVELVQATKPLTLADAIGPVHAEFRQEGYDGAEIDRWAEEEVKAHREGR